MIGIKDSLKNNVCTLSTYGGLEKLGELLLFEGVIGLKFDTNVPIPSADQGSC